MRTITTGYGDYWGKCYADPLDPRSWERSDSEEAAYFICGEITRNLQIATAAVHRGDMTDVWTALSQIHALTAPPY